MQSRYGFFRRHLRTFGALLFVFAYSASITLAVPPATKYQPGETLNPDCAPTATNCSVQILPDQSGNTNRLLTTDGSTTSWTDALTGVSISGSTNTLSNIPNAALTNSSITINGNPVSLGGSVSNLALTTGTLAQFASTTSLQLADVISDETGSGLAVFATSPVLTTPNIGAATGSSLNLGSGAITSGLINGQTISSAANFTGTAAFAGNVTVTNQINFTNSNTSILGDGTDLILNAIPGSSSRVVFYASGAYRGAWTSGGLSVGKATTANATLDVDGTATFSGNVGIGTASPAAKFDVSGTIRATGTTTPASGVGAELAWDGSSSYVISYDRSNALYKPLALSALSMTFYTNGSNRLTIDASGNLIATDLAGSGNRCLYADSSGQINAKGFDCGSASGGDNLGDHVATQAIALSGNWLSNDGGAEGIRVDNNGNVGIGIASPLATLDVQAATASVRVLSTTGTNYAYQVFANTSGSVYLGAENSAGGGIFTGSAAYAGVLGSMGARSLQFATNGIVRQTIDSSGNVGIGITGPSSLLHVVGNADSLVGGQLTNTNTGTAAGARWVISADTANTTVETLSSTYTDAGLRQANNGVILNTGSGTLNLAQGTTASTSAIRFFTNGIAAANERMRITSTGNVGIGTASPSSKLTVVGDGMFSTASVGANLGLFVYNTDTTDGASNAMLGSTVNDTTGGDPLVRMLINGVGGFLMGVDNSDSDKFKISSTYNNLDGGARMTITTGGNVGIGTTTPTSARGSLAPVLALSGTQPEFQITSAGASSVATFYHNWDAGPSNQRLELSTGAGNGTKYFQFYDNGNFAVPTGNVSIGTTGSTMPLNVVKDGLDEIGTTTRAIAKFMKGDASKGLYIGYDSSENLGIEHCQGGSCGIAWTTHNGSAWGERMRIHTNGNVGIGTASPVAKLQISGSGTSGQVTSSFILQNTSSGTFGLDITGSAGASVARFLYGGGPSTGTNTLTSGMVMALEGASAGNVGIGTTSPSALVHAYQTGSSLTAPTMLVHDFSLTPASGKDVLRVVGRDNAGSSYLFHVLGNNGVIDAMAITDEGLIGAGTATPTARFEIAGGSNVAGNSSLKLSSAVYPWIDLYSADTNTDNRNWRIAGVSTNYGTFEILNSSAANGTPSVSRLAITRDGNVGVGIGSPLSGGGASNWLTLEGSAYSGGVIYSVGGAAAGYQYYDNNTDSVATQATGTKGISFYTNGATRMTVNGSNGSVSIVGLVSCGGVQTNGGGTMSCTSDETLKDRHGAFTTGLDAIRQINPESFSWKEDSGLYDDGIVYYGFIAQNVQEALPEAISYSAGGKLQVSQLTLMAAAINAIKELDIQVQAIPVFEDATLYVKVADFLRGIANDIATIGRVQTDELCIKNTCVTEEQLQQLLSNQPAYSGGSSGDDEEDEPVDENPPEETPEEEELPPSDEEGGEDVPSEGDEESTDETPAEEEPVEEGNDEPADEGGDAPAPEGDELTP